MFIAVITLQHGCSVCVLMEEYLNSAWCNKFLTLSFTLELNNKAEHSGELLEDAVLSIEEAGTCQRLHGGEIEGPASCPGAGSWQQL